MGSYFENPEVPVIFHKTNHALFKFLAFIFCTQVAIVVSGQIKNIKFSDLPKGISSPSGVSIAINHKDKKNMVAGMGLNQLLCTVDGGKTWKTSATASTFGEAGDPVLFADPKGNFQYLHLSDASGKGAAEQGWLDRIVCQTSIDSGRTWTKGVSIGNNPAKDHTNPRVSGHFELSTMYLTWTQSDHFGSEDSICQSNIFFSKSSHGKKWSDPVQINRITGDCRNGDNTPSGALTAINTDGRLFVVWSNQEEIYLDRSYDDGDTWLGTDLAIAHQPGGASMNIPGFGKCSGLPTLVVDNSETFFRGSLYVVYADQSSGENDTDIWLIRSINRGDSWSKPLRINKDGLGKHQFMPMMTVDPATGVVYIVYYDRRAYDDQQTDVYLAYSLDGTNHFSEVKISESAFSPKANTPLVDHLGIAAFKGIIAPVWMRMDDGNSSIWGAVINQEELFKLEDLPTLQSMRRQIKSLTPTHTPSQGKGRVNPRFK